MIIFVIIASLGQMVAPAIVSAMLDYISANDKKMIIILAIAMIVISIVACITNVVATNLAASLTTRFAADLRKEVFNKVQSFFCR